MLGRAADQARRLDHGWVGPEHYLLALLTEPSVATEALAELGVTYDRLDEQLHSQQEEPESALPRYDQAKGLSPNPAAYKLEARAEGLALAWGHRWPVPEHFLLAMVDEDDGMAARLHSLGASQPAILEVLGDVGRWHQRRLPRQGNRPRPVPAEPAGPVVRRSRHRQAAVWPVVAVPTGQTCLVRPPCPGQPPSGRPAAAR
jgi:ATP-dependent Clp protease ATP-binding subunit ClpA